MHMYRELEVAGNPVIIGNPDCNDNIHIVCYPWPDRSSPFLSLGGFSTPSVSVSQRYGGIELVYEINTSITSQFHLCSVINCVGKNTSWHWFDVYLCRVGWLGKQRWCPTWNFVWHVTNRNFVPKTRTPDRKMWSTGYFQLQREYSPAQNQIFLSIFPLTQNPYHPLPAGNWCWKGQVNTFYLPLRGLA